MACANVAGMASFFSLQLEVFFPSVFFLLISTLGLCTHLEVAARQLSKFAGGGEERDEGYYWTILGGCGRWW